MKRRLFAGFLALMLLSMALPMVMATETEDPAETTEETESRYSMETSGTCGKNVTWKLDGHTLTITGSGAIDAGCPWEFYKDSIHTLILDGEITHIGDEAFSSCNNLTYIDFGSSLKEIGYQSFYSCNALEAIRLPDSFRKFGTECFRDCENLQVVYCEGPMPSFRGSCLYTDHTVRVFYSHKTPWPQEEVSRLMQNFGSRLYVEVGSEEVLADYLDSSAVSAAKAEPAPTETAAEPTVPETLPPEPTVPETLPPAVTEPPVTEPVLTEPAEAPTVAVTEPTAPVFELAPEEILPDEPAEETAPQQPRQEKERPAILLWVLIAAAVVTGILILALIIRMIVHSGGRYSD